MLFKKIKFPLAFFNVVHPLPGANVLSVLVFCLRVVIFISIRNSKLVVFLSDSCQVLFKVFSKAEVSWIVKGFAVQARVEE